MTLFRRAFSPRETLAIDPRALDVQFDGNGPSETTCTAGVAIVSVCGPLEHHRSILWDSYDDIVCRLEAAFACDEVAAVVMCIDSPGGDAAGATEAHRAIRRLKKKYKKPLYAFSNEAMYSAAYAVGSAADEIWVPETGGVGSVGVICALLDKTAANEQAGLDIRLLTTGARKADTHADRPITDDVLAAMQARVDYLGDVFFRVVASARGMSPKDVASLEAGVFLGPEAVDAGLADAVGGWYTFLSYVGKTVGATDILDTHSSKSESTQMTIAELRKAKAEAARKLAAAKSSAERTKLFSAYEGAVASLVKAEMSAKTKYVRKTEERLTKDEDDEDENEDEDAEEEESEEEESEEEEKSEEEESEEEEEEEEEKAKSKKAKAKASIDPHGLSLKTMSRIVTAASKITGTNDPSEIVGALEGMGPRVRAMPRVEQRLAKIESNALRTKVRGMLDAATRDRKLTPASAKALEAQGMRDPKWLKGYLSVLAPIVRGLDEEQTPDVNAASPTLDTQGLSRDQKKMLEQAAQSAGMSVEDYTKEIQKTQNSRMSNGVTPKLF